MSLRIVVDGDADIPPQLEDKVAYVPQYVIYDGVSYKATKELILHKMESMLDPGKLSTSMPSAQDFVDALKELDYPALAIHVSSGISSTYQSIKTAAETVGVLDKLYMFDTKTAASGIGVYVYLAYELLKQGATAREVYDTLVKLRDNRREKTYALVGDVRFALHGGRVRGIAAAAAKAMHFMVVVSPDEEGYIQAIYKTMGRRKAIRYILERARQSLKDAESPIVGISHAWADKDASMIAETLRKERPDASIFVTYMNPTLVAHGGKGTLAVSVLDANV
jgi:DegV family protein with EDD domain